MDNLNINSTFWQFRQVLFGAMPPLFGLMPKIDFTIIAYYSSSKLTLLSFFILQPWLWEYYFLFACHVINNNVKKFNNAHHFDISPIDLQMSIYSTLVRINMYYTNCYYRYAVYLLLFVSLLPCGPFAHFPSRMLFCGLQTVTPIQQGLLGRFLTSWWNQLKIIIMSLNWRLFVWVFV